MTWDPCAPRKKRHPYPEKYRGAFKVTEIAEIEGVSRRTVIYWAKKGWPKRLRDPDGDPCVRR